MLSPIFESFYQDRTRAGVNDICMNLYPEHADGANGPEISLLISCPGYTSVATVGSGPIRGMYVAADNNLYVVSGNGLYYLNTSLVATQIGLLNTSTGAVSIIDSPTQILVVDGTAAYLYEKSGSDLQIVIPNNIISAINPTVAVFQDGFGIINSAESNIIYQSNYNDLSSFAAPTGSGGFTANNAYVQINADPIVTLFDVNHELWILKTKSVEVWVNAGNSGFAFVPIQGVYIMTGCDAPQSVARIGKSLIWLGSNELGDGVIVITKGYDVVTISTFYITSIINSLPTVSDATAYTIQWDNHWFYVITFPSANITLAYDLVTGKWHRRAYFSTTGMNREQFSCQENYNYQNLCGDYQNGNIYALSDSVFTHNGNPIRWERSWRALPNTAPITKPVSFDELQVLVQTGQQNNAQITPNIMLRWSDDGGYTWSNEILISAGLIGQSSWRCIARRLGTLKLESGLDRIFEISGTDPMQILLTGAEVEAGPS